MNRNTTRFASLGGILILGACALALAQHDSRNREREPIRQQALASQPAKPIAVEGDWTPPFDQQASTGSELPQRNSFRLSDDPNPLRNAMDASRPTAGIALPLYDDESEIRGLKSEPPVQSASGRSVAGAVVSVALPEDPPAWVADEKLPNAPPPIGTPRTTVGTSTPPNANSKLKPPGLPQSSEQAKEAATGVPQAKPSAQPSAPPPSYSRSSPLPSLPSMPANASPPRPSNSRETSATQPDTTLSTPTNAGSQLAQPALPQSSSVTNNPAQRSNGTNVGGKTPQTTNSLPSLPSSAQSANSRLTDLPTTQRPALPATNMTAIPQAGRNPSVAGANSAPHQASTSGQSLPNASRNASPAIRATNLNDGPTSTATGNGAGTRSLTDIPTGQTARPNTGGNYLPQSSNTVRSSGGDSGSANLQLASNRPGNRYLDGTQAPSMLIQKRAPEEIRVGKKATFVISVRNAGNAVAHDVTVVDVVPKGMRFVDAMPTATPDSSGGLRWSLGEIAAGEERTITLQVVPEVQGELGSVASVQFAAQASVRTVATLPKLELDLQSQSDVLIGDVHEISVNVRNTGTGVARVVRLEADLPPTVKHESGDTKLEAIVGDMRPNESKNIRLRLRAVQAGQAACAIRAISEDNISAESAAELQVRAPQLIASIEGPRVRYLDRQATYRVLIKNTGTAAATDLDFQLHLPAGLRFNVTDEHGQYDAQSHTVVWGLHELAAGQTAPVEVTVMPVELGSQVVSFTASGNLGVQAEARSELTVNGLADLAFSIAQDNSTIEAGATTTYSVTVENVGTRADKNVQLAVELPPQAEMVAVINAPAAHQVKDRQLVFAPLAEMRSNDQHVYRFQVRHNQPGTQIIRTRLVSANSPKAVVKEEDTLVYNDQQ